jgi:hypothetical protein
MIGVTLAHLAKAPIAASVLVLVLFDGRGLFHSWISEEP